MPAAVAAIPAIETSLAMKTAGFDGSVSLAAQAFVSDLATGDSLAVATVGAQAQIVYPPSGALVAVDGTLSQLTAANQVIAGLAYADTEVQLGTCLPTLYALLAGAPAGTPTGVVLFSLGNSTGGPDPLTLSSYSPTWTCAPGPTANGTLLTQLANLSGGAYFYAPTPNDMGTVLNQVRARRASWSMVLNQAKTVQPLGFWLQPVTVASGVASAQFSIVWENAAVAWNGSSNPGPNQVSVTLVQPPGLVRTVPPTLSGGGFCVFDVTTPSPGTWYVQVMYPGSAALPMTAGVFCLAGSRTMPQLRFAADRADGALVLRASLEGIDAVEVQSSVASLATARASLAQLARRYRHDLPSGEPLEAFAALRNACLPVRDLFEHARTRHLLRFDRRGEASLTVPEPPAGTSLTVKADVSGTHSGSAPFQLSELVSLYIEPPAD